MITYLTLAIAVCTLVLVIVAYAVENYVIIPRSHLEEYNKSIVEVSIQEKGIQFSGNGKDFEEVPSITHVKVGGEIISRKEEKYY